MFLAYRLKECVQTNDKRLDLLALQSRSANMLSTILANNQEEDLTPPPPPKVVSSIPEDPLDRYFSKESVLLPHTTGV